MTNLFRNLNEADFGRKDYCIKCLKRRSIRGKVITGFRTF